MNLGSGSGLGFEWFGFMSRLWMGVSYFCLSFIWASLANSIVIIVRQKMFQLFEFFKLVNEISILTLSFVLKLDEIVMHISISLNDALKRLGQLVQLFTCETIHGGYTKSYDTLCNQTM